MLITIPIPSPLGVETLVGLRYETGVSSTLNYCTSEQIQTINPNLKKKCYNITFNC